MSNATETYNNLPKCPTCGYQDPDWWEIQAFDGDEYEQDCEECGESLIIRRHISVSHSTRVKGDDY